MTSTPAETAFEERLAAFAQTHDTERLATRLAASGSGDVDIVWCTHDSPVGTLLLALAGDALVRVAFEREGFDVVLESLGERVGRRTLRAAAPADDLRRQLDEYFAGVRSNFETRTDLRLSSAPFRREVQSKLADIPYGTTASYAQVATNAGRPKAVRAVGSACATNPLPIVLPCHRVVRSDGGYGNYLGGEEAKRFLLDHEHAHAPAAACG